MTNLQPKILVVDDDPSFRHYIREVLEAAEYEVLEANDGIEALDTVNNTPIGMILADVAMPRMNGYQLFEQLCQHPEWSRIPFIFLSARAMDSDVRFAKEMGVDDYLVKDFLVEDLLSTVTGKLRLAQRYTKGLPVESKSVLQGSDTLVIGPLKIDTLRHNVWFREKLLRLSAREFLLLHYLAERATYVVPLVELVQVTHNRTTDNAEAGNLIRPLIRSLRRKFGYETGDMGFIENIRGVGYQLLPPE